MPQSISFKGVQFTKQIAERASGNPEQCVLLLYYTHEYLCITVYIHLTTITHMKRKYKRIYLVTIPVQLVSIFLNSTEERKEGSLQTSLVMDLNSAIEQ